MKYKLCGWQCVLALAVLHVGLAHSWDLAIAEGQQLKFYTINGTLISNVWFNTQNLGAIAYDDVHNMILYVDKQTDNDALCSYDVSNGAHIYLTKRNRREIHSLAFDPVTETLFFSDTNERSINWFSLKPGFKNNDYGNLLLKMDDGVPTDIALDRCSGYIYWMNTNCTQPSIERARFNGTDRKVVINTVSLSINSTYKMESHSLIIDEETKQMFWYEPSTPLQYFIYSADLYGGNKTKITKLTFQVHHKLHANPSNTLIVSNIGLVTRGWCSTCPVWSQRKLRNVSQDIRTLFSLHSEIPISIAANYKLKDHVVRIPDCEALMELRRNDEGTTRGAEKYDTSTFTSTTGVGKVRGSRPALHSNAHMFCNYILLVLISSIISCII